MEREILTEFWRVRWPGRPVVAPGMPEAARRSRERAVRSLERKGFLAVRVVSGRPSRLYAWCIDGDHPLEAQ